MAAVSPAGAVGVQALQARIVENGAGTYTADFVLPAGSTLVDIIIEGEALWTAATSASLEIGDSADPDGYWTAVDLKATDLLAGESLSLASNQLRGSTEIGAYGTVGTSTQLNRRYSASERTITATVVSVGAGTAGRTRITVLYFGGSPTVISQ